MLFATPLEKSRGAIPLASFVPLIMVLIFSHKEKIKELVKS